MIDKFEGYYQFLRNDYTCNVEYDGLLFPSIEHAWQASKTKDVSLREKIQNASLSEARKIGKKEIILDPEWDTEENKLAIMLQLQMSKFTNLKLKLKLLLTGNLPLVQGNMTYDTFWGQNVHGVGENHNGKILMQVREKIKNNEGNVIEIIEKELEKIGFDKNILSCDFTESDSITNPTMTVNFDF